MIPSLREGGRSLHTTFVWRCYYDQCSLDLVISVQDEAISLLCLLLLDACVLEEFSWMRSFLE